MIGLDYVPLEDHAGHTRSHLPRTALKLLGVMGVAFAGARTLLFSSTGGSKAAFVPEQGVQAVTVKPGPTGPLVLAAPVQAAMDAVHCLFAYGSITEPLPDKAAFAKGITASDAWLYGAKLSGTPFALPTGQAGDIVKGRLLCWDVSEFAGKLSELDKVWSYQADKTGPGAVQRSVASVVQEDGHTTYAHFYYALQAAGAQPTITELFKDTFYPTLEEAGDTLVVVDFFTDWCGPCKLMYPKLLEFAREFPDVKFVKVNANDDFKDIGRVLKIQAAPTFHLYRQNNLLAVMSGAKVDELKQLIITHRPPPPVPTAAPGEIAVLDKDSFFPAIEAAGNKLLVVEFYTEWCRACKALNPRLKRMQEAYKDKGVLIYKANADEDFRDIGMAIGIKVTPTIYLYREGEVVASMTGNDGEKLEAMLIEHMDK